MYDRVFDSFPRRLYAKPASWKRGIREFHDYRSLKVFYFQMLYGKFLHCFLSAGIFDNPTERGVGLRVQVEVDCH